MIRKLVVVAVVLVLIGFGVFWFLTTPQTLVAGELPQHTPNLDNGTYMFAIGGCESCHAAKDAKGEDLLRLGGGQVLDTPFGKFHVPNISPDKEHGIGNWTAADFVNAMKYGIGPEGTHLYPAFPYTSYQRMTVEDILDLKAYLDTLPPVVNDVPPHELSFPFNIRRGLGLWQRLYVDGRTFMPDPSASPEVNRGAYLVRGPGHCGECHSPRNIIGGIDSARAYAGGPSPEGQGWIPNITTDKETGIGNWSEADIVTLLETGFTPEFDSVGGQMAAVVRNTARLTPEDRAAIAAYLKTLPAIRNARPPASAAPTS